MTWPNIPGIFHTTLKQPVQQTINYATTGVFSRAKKTKDLNRLRNIYTFKKIETIV